MTDSSRTAKHLPTCESVSVAAMAAERGHDTPWQFGGLHLMRCDAACPILARAVERGRGLAAKHGWDSPDA